MFTSRLSPVRRCNRLHLFVRQMINRRLMKALSPHPSQLEGEGYKCSFAVGVSFRSRGAALVLEREGLARRGFPSRLGARRQVPDEFAVIGHFLCDVLDDLCDVPKEARDILI